jgi:ApaG protein
MMTEELYPFTAETRGITVSVASIFLPHESVPAQDRYVWAYRVRIANGGEDQVQLIARHWIITDGRGRTEHVQGAGVVGEQPVLSPGQAFEYTSGCPLSTPSGFMVGTYQMITADGDAFDIEIPAFSLDSPHAGQTLN